MRLRAGRHDDRRAAPADAWRPPGPASGDGRATANADGFRAGGKRSARRTIAHSGGAALGLGCACA
jgi:hypothetical protein